MTNSLSDVVEVFVERDFADNVQEDYEAQGEREH
jgi:hypothetical protein